MEYDKDLITRQRDALFETNGVLEQELNTMHQTLGRIIEAIAQLERRIEKLESKNIQELIFPSEGGFS